MAKKVKVTSSRIGECLSMQNEIKQYFVSALLFCYLNILFALDPGKRFDPAAFKYTLHKIT